MCTLRSCIFVTDCIHIEALGGIIPKHVFFKALLNPAIHPSLAANRYIGEVLRIICLLNS